MKPATHVVRQGHHIGIVFACSCNAPCDRNNFLKHWHCDHCNTYHFDNQGALDEFWIRIKRSTRHLLVYDSCGRARRLDEPWGEMEEPPIEWTETLKVST